MANKTTKKTAAARRAEIAKRMHIAKMCDGGFHILEIPAADGSPFEVWQGPFNTKRAAELFLEDLLDALPDGNPDWALNYHGRCRGYNQQANVLEFLEGRDDIADPRSLARDLCAGWPFDRGFGDEIPF